MIKLFGLRIFTKKELLKISDAITITVDNTFKSYGRSLKLQDFNRLKNSLKKAFRVNDNSQNAKHV